MSTDDPSDLSDPREREELVPWEATGLAESSEVLDDSLRTRRAVVAGKWARKSHPTAMLEVFSRLLNFLGTIFFAHVLFEDSNVESIKKAADKSTLVYVMRSRSLLDYLYFNWAFLKHQLPVARFSNGRKTVFLRGFWRGLGHLLSRRDSVKPEELMQSLIEHQHAVFLFLEKPKDDSAKNVEYSQRFLFRLIRAQKSSVHPIQIVPMVLVWEKRPDSKHPTILDDIFGTAQSPGFWRRFVNFFQGFWQSFLKFGQPVVQVSKKIALSEFLREYPVADSADASDILRANLLETLGREEHVILGPTGEEPSTIWRDIARRPEITEKVTELAIERQVSEDVLMAEAKQHFEEIAADPNLMMIKVLSSLLSLVWYRIYDGFEVDHEGMARLREAAHDSQIVLVPSHKSHVDYLVLSYLFYQYGLTPPLIAAGVNLAFWPVGYIFRKSGAFFLRRTFKGAPLYSAVFREYVIRILEEGYPLEFFIEGSRSRTGKLIKPRYGMIDMVVRAYISGRLDSLKLVPISVGYEKIIEERAYRKEILGAQKEKETLGGLLKAPKLLTSKYGRLYVEFSDPIDVQDYLDKYEINRKNPSDEEIRALTVRLAHRVIYDINEVTTVTPTALAATVLLNNEGRGIDRARLLLQVGFIVHFLGEPRRISRMSRSLEDALIPLREQSSRTPAEVGEALSVLMDRTLELFEKSDQIKITHVEEKAFYSVPEDARFELSYYRNNIVHHFVPEALLAAAIARFESDEILLTELMSETLFLSRLFKHEWIYEERAEFENVFFRTLDYFQEKGWAQRHWDDEGERVKIVDAAPLEFFRRLVLTFLEAYAIVAFFISKLERPTGKKEIVDRSLKQARSDYLGGQILFHESLSKPTYENAVRLFEDWGILEQVEGKKEPYVLTESWKGPKILELHTHMEDFVYRGKASESPRVD